MSADRHHRRAGADPDAITATETGDDMPYNLSALAAGRSCGQPDSS